MLKGFKAFLFRGNIVDLAVAVVIGTAFTALVGAFTADFVNPIVNRFAGGSSEAGAVGIGNGQYLEYGHFITAIITFVITAAVVYFFVVLPMKRFMERIAPGDAPAPSTEDVLLLREIRDLLGRDAGVPATPSTGEHRAT